MMMMSKLVSISLPEDRGKNCLKVKSASVFLILLKLCLPAPKFSLRGTGRIMRTKFVNTKNISKKQTKYGYLEAIM